MRSLLFFFALLLFVSTYPAHGRQSESVLKKLDQLNKRVNPRLHKLLNKAGLKYPPTDVYIRVHKFEGIVELFARNEQSAPFTSVTTYPAYNLPKNYRNDELYQFVDAGPKEQQGDIKVPEGIFKILYHNPWSSYHLSLALGFPNPADAIRAHQRKVINDKGKRAIMQWWSYHGKTVDKDMIAGIPGVWSNKDAVPAGNEIFMHGKNVTIGCVPVGDRNIEEIFLLTDPRLVGGTEVHIFPFDFREQKNEAMRRRYEKLKPWLKEFWSSLEEIHDYFDNTGRLPNIYIDKTTGRYHLNNAKNRLQY